MVHMIGGPSVSGYKSYRNQTIARPGQWRMPRNYGGGSTRITVKNYCHCNCNRGYGFQLPAWLQWMQFGMGLFGQVFSMFAPQQTTTPETKPETSELEELKKKIEEQEQEIEELKKQKEPEGPKKPESPNKPEAEDDDLSAASIDKRTTAEQNDEEDVKYEPTYFPSEHKRSHWADFAAAYDFKAPITAQQVYHALQQRNGYSKDKINPPKNMMLPKTLDLGNGVTVTRKDQYTIAKHDIPQNERGNHSGSATGGTPKITKVPGSTSYQVTHKDGSKQIFTDESAARADYKKDTGKDFTGNYGTY